MGFFEDIEDFIDEITDGIDDDADEVTVEIVTSKGDLDKRIKELEDDGYTLVKEEKPEKKEKKCKVTLDDLFSEDEEEDELLEDLRIKAKKQREEMVEKLGEEKTKKIIRISALSAMITNLMTKSVPLDQKMVDEYNGLCRELNPVMCEDFMLKLIYMLVEHTTEKASESIG